ncbi:MAG: hypothetical protein ABS88_01320 [Sphingopyxis sp. SCN 67-31]|nr:MAG: hypothetical protein ABS88_01320 [Sphingopyxis sp. SCN 67-31]
MSPYSGDEILAGPHARAATAHAQLCFAMQALPALRICTTWHMEQVAKQQVDLELDLPLG